ncbi:MAG TPA: GNAT family N-acetyltransferase [Burkholderiales bacterium]|jgi:GNAT superfamily N-acetyltransferase|nr:GNAT family N-acetyltransferase [Burkholderiales bacterium]
MRFAPATSARWKDLETLFGPNGACAGCWCMWFRLPRREWTAAKGEGNRRALRRLVGRRVAPGILAYEGGKPVGWVAFAPRAEYVRLAASRNLKPLDARPVWSVSCFFVARSHRGKGLMTQLIEAAADYARKRGATLLEGYPSDPRRRTADTFIYTGTLGAFERAGFKVAARPSKAVRIVRRAA